MSSIGAGLVIPDLWQQEAVRALQQGKDVVVQAPTGSGKTYIFELLYPNLKTQAVVTVPTRALAFQLLSLSPNNGRRSAPPLQFMATTKHHKRLMIPERHA